tara:strand:- start:613 stop:1041 length:429 start_codon:yes stop_codon:yes gene_type:complete
MANFSLPPIKEALPSVPSLSKEELCSLPSTSLVSLSNNMAVVKSEASMKAAQLQARAKKLTGEASVNIPGKGRNSIASTQSIENVKASMQSTIGPVNSTTNLMGSISQEGAEIVNNANAAGTSQTAANDALTKINSFTTEIL